MNSIEFYQISNKNIRAEFSNFGASLYSLEVKDKNNNWLQILSTPSNKEDFISNYMSFGKTVGPTAGVIHKPGFKINDDFIKIEENLLHSGKYKISTEIFKAELLNKEIIFTLITKPNEIYKASLEIEIKYKLTKNNLNVYHKVKTTNDTIVNLTFHPYFNLDQTKDLKNHQLKIYSPFKLKRIDGVFKEPIKTTFDKINYTNFRELEINDNNQLDDIYLAKSYIKKSLVLKTDKISMTVKTNYPALVLYSQNRDTEFELSNNSLGSKYSSLAIEGQKLQSKLPILRKNEKYQYKIKYQFKTHN